MLITIAEAARDAHEGHGDDVHVDLEPGDPGFGLAACPAGVSAAGEEPAGAGDDTPTRPGTTPPPLGAGIQAVPPTTEQAAPAADVPAPPSIDQNEPVASIPAAPSNTDERVLAAAASALDAAFGESQASVVPAGAVAAGDGSSATDGRGTLPFAVGGAALAAAAGAAFAARRSSRASD
ncbi:MAG TPA: hypothetical protein VK402_11715 [Blastococcus sp.]|nr:hypothetical protein [Blastococcus sp.]